MRLIFRRCPRSEPPLQPLERAFGVLTAVDARRAEEDHGVLNVLRLEPFPAFEILRQDPDRPCFCAFQELVIEIRKRLWGHGGQIRCRSRKLLGRSARSWEMLTTTTIEPAGRMPRLTSAPLMRVV